MSEIKELQRTELNHVLEGVSRFSATALANKISAITIEVFKRGMTVITNHNEPTMVLMSIDRYIQLERAAKPNLDLLTKEFDDMYARMQRPGIAEKTTAALDLDNQ